MPRNMLTDEEKGIIVGMHQGGMTVQNVIKVYRERGTVARPKHAGRPPKLSERDIRHAVREKSRGDNMTLGEITNTLPVKMSQATVRKALRTHSSPHSQSHSHSQSRSRSRSHSHSEAVNVRLRGRQKGIFVILRRSEGGRKWHSDNW
ncbi:hypothetical protein BGX29_008372 [Mortierella sp. GBA35]|nr:hypothetical protein BGX29_008372 [Mortierella sp. GBA35]